MEITKESLIQARENVNEAVLKIKQQYSCTSKNKKILIVVEGKDDITYYGVKTNDYQSKGYKISVIPAGNRKKVIDAYKSIDWHQYEKPRILFIVDRDLSDYTYEFTPCDENIYITDKYSIENDLCCYLTFINTLKYYCGLNDIDDNDETELRDLYFTTTEDFYKIITPIMGLILYWKINGISANYANVNCNNLFMISDSDSKISAKYEDQRSLLQYICQLSGVPYDSSINIEEYVEKLNEKNTPGNYIRGKYILSFFACILNYVARNSEKVLTSKKSAKMSISVGARDAISKLCALMPVPQTLQEFFDKNVGVLCAS